MSDVISHDEAHHLAALVRSVRDTGIEVPKNVDAEAKLYREYTRDKHTPADADVAAAVNALSSVPADEFAASVPALTTAALARDAYARDVKPALRGIIAARLRRAVYGAMGDWQAAIVERFNETVDSSGINDTAPHLPDFSDPASITMWNLSGVEGRAIGEWRSTCDALHPLWNLYKRIAREDGHEVGPSGPDYLSVNLFTAAVLGDPQTLGRAESAAIRMAGIAQNSDATKSFGPLMPFVIPALCGYELHLSTPDDALAIRRGFQPGAA